MVPDLPMTQSFPYGGCTRGLSVGVKMNVGTRAGRGREYCDQSAKKFCCHGEEPELEMSMSPAEAASGFPSEPSLPSRIELHVLS